MTSVTVSGPWVSWEEAAALADVRVPTIEHAVRGNRIKRSPRNGPLPTLDRASVLEWADWYHREKAGRAQRRSERERLRETRAARRRDGRPDGRTRVERLAALAARPAAASRVDDGDDGEAAEWMSASAAALALDCSTSSVLRWAEAGLLEVGAIGDEVRLSRASVLQLADRRAADAREWVSQAGAAAIVGCSHARVPHLVAEGLLVQRPGPRVQASISRASAEQAAQVWSDRLKVAKAARDERVATRRSNAAPKDGQVWMTTATAALVLGMSRNGVGERIRAGTLPAVLRGNRYWLRRTDVETAAAARAFASREAASPQGHGARVL
jgi:excisionase family DNA binding protein